jgi:pimeloyl-ACP methyl ester carboxylesterase
MMNKYTAETPHIQEVNGINLHYVTWGEFTQPEHAVLLVPGLTANYLEFSLLGPTLAERGWYAIAPELRGRGQSDKPPHGYGIPYHANDLLALCDALNLPTAHIIGHSLGGLIGFFLAAIHPKRLGKLVLVDTGGRVSPDALQAIGPSLERLGKTYPSLDAYLQERQQSPIHSWNPFWEAYYRYDAEVQPDGTAKSRIPKAAIEEELLVNASLNLDVLLSRIHAPTLIARAPMGTLAPDRGFVMAPGEAERVKGIIAGCRVVEIPNTNHYTIILSEVFNREVPSFLTSAD